MRAVVVAVGTEMLLFGRSDGNGDWICDRLARSGIAVVGRAVVGDDVSRIARAVRAALDDAELVVVTGGLGPTDDDRTREGLAEALDRPLHRDGAEVERLRAAFAARGVKFRPVQERQADRPAGARWIDNPLGSAAGLALEVGERRIVALPGVPAEMRRMLEDGVLPWLAAAPRAALARGILRVAGRTESSVDEQVRDLYGVPGVTVTILSAREGIELHLVAEASTADEARDRLARVEGEMAARLGHDVYSRGESSLAAVVGALLRDRARTVAAAESCTAGLLAATLTAVPGASAWFRGGIVAYADELKVELVGVPASALAEHGAVSEAVALALAAGIRQRCATDFGLAITGIAGPAGGSPEKPVGLVYSALADVRGASAWRTRWIGDRSQIRARAVTFTLDRLRRRLLEADPGDRG